MGEPALPIDAASEPLGGDVWRCSRCKSLPLLSVRGGGPADDLVAAPGAPARAPAPPDGHPAAEGSPFSAASIALSAAMLLLLALLLVALAQAALGWLAAHAGVVGAAAVVRHGTAALPEADG